MHILLEIANMVASFQTMQLIQDPLPPSTVILHLQVHERSLSMAATPQWSNPTSWSVELLQLTLSGQHEIPLIPNSSIMLISETQAHCLGVDIDSKSCWFGGRGSILFNDTFSILL